MARSKYKKKIKNGIEYYFYRINDNRLENPKDLYGKTTNQRLFTLQNWLHTNQVKTRQYDDNTDMAMIKANAYERKLTLQFGFCNYKKDSKRALWGINGKSAEVAK